MSQEQQIDNSEAALMPVEAVMKRLSVGRSSVFNLMASGELRSTKIGRRRLISEASLREFIAKVDQTGCA